MQENWYSIKGLNKLNVDEIRAEIVTDSNSPWFSGHFPGDPILPGIAQVSFIYDVIAQCEGIDRKDFHISGLKRVRFRNFIKPGDLLKIEIKINKKSSYNFKLFKDEELACTGTLLLS